MVGGVVAVVEVVVVVVEERHQRCSFCVILFMVDDERRLRDVNFDWSGSRSQITLFFLKIQLYPKFDSFPK